MNGQNQWKIIYVNLGTASLDIMQLQSWIELVLPWLCKINNAFYTAKYLFTVDYTERSRTDPAQHKQSHVLYLLDAGK